MTARAYRVAFWVCVAALLVVAVLAGSAQVPEHANCPWDQDCATPYEDGEP